MMERTITMVMALAAFAVAGESLEGLKETVRKQGELIEQLRGEVQGLRGQNRAALESEIQAYLDATEAEPERPTSKGAGALFGGRVRVGGYFSLEFRDDGDASTMEFDQHRLVPKIQADVAPGITFETEIEIEGGGADVDFLDGNEVLVEYAELSFEIVEGKLNFRAGLILVPWGRFNSVHDDPLNDLTDRPLVSQRVGAVAFDQPGVAIDGTLEPVAGWFLDYDLALVQGFDDGFSTNGGVRDSRQSFRSDNNNNKQVFGRFVLAVPLRALDALEVGVSLTHGKHDDAGMFANYGYGLDLFLKEGKFEFRGEYMNLRIEQPSVAAASEPRRMDGWYVELAYHLFPDAWRGSHSLFTDESTFTFVVRIEGIDLNHLTSGSTFRDDLDSISIGFNFRPVERTVFKIDYTFVDSKQAGFGGGAADIFTISWASFF